MNSKTGRNAPCPCGSGKKYKRCCLDDDMEHRKTTNSTEILLNSEKTNDHPELEKKWQTSYSLRNWVRDGLFDGFRHHAKGVRFIQEKIEKVNGQIYKYCPIHDDNDAIQYSIENLKESILYMSRISSFNDPFDTSITFSIEKIIKELIPVIIEQSEDSSIDEESKKILAPLFELIIEDEKDAEQSEVAIEYLYKCFVKNPALFNSGDNPTELITTFTSLLAEDYSSGTITENKMDTLLNTLTDMASNPSLLTKIMLKILIKNPEILISAGVEFGEQEKQAFNEVFNGKSPEIKEAKEIYNNLIKDYEDAFIKAMESARQVVEDTFFITCFSISADNALMWAHYANKHKGFCIEYNLHKSNDSTFLVHLLPVLYSRSRATIPASLFDVEDINNVKISTTDESTSDIICALLTKSDVWKYEEEWRLILTNESAGLVDQKFKTDCIEKIILGCRIEKQYEEEIANICKDKGWHLSKMRLDENGYLFHEDIIF